MAGTEDEREYLLDLAAPPLPARCRTGPTKKNMPRSSSPVRDEETPHRRRRKEKEHDRESTSSREKDKERQRRSESKLSGLGAEEGEKKKVRKHRRRSKSREGGVRERDSHLSSTATRERREGKEREKEKEKKVSMVVPEMERRVSTSGEAPKKSSYPTFSKAHSREAVGSREDVGNTKGTPFTPEATEISGMEKEKEARPKSTPAPTRAPPSPPLTAESPARSGSRGSLRKAAEEVKNEIKDGRRSTEVPAKGTAGNSAKNSRSNLSLRKDARLGDSEVSSMPGAFPEDERKSTPTSGYRRTVSTGSQPASIISQTTNSEHSEHSERTNTDSDATSIAPGQKRPERPRVKTNNDASPPSVTDSQPKTPTPLEQTFPTHHKQPTKTPIIDVAGANAYTSNHFGGLDPKTPMTAMPLPMNMSMPPPPPPPPMPPPPPTQGTPTVPRVDYLLKNGGLGTLIPRRLVPQQPVQAYNMYQSPAIGSIAPIEEYAKIFGSLHKRLDDYLHVLRSSGSMAVATGYKSVARRLLDKLSQVFARDISSQRCDCVVCKTTPQPTLSDEEDSGVSWGEILEFVSGRREYPQWPPFTIEADDAGLGISTGGLTAAPMQKLDIDVPEEYKDHYIRQNQKTKKAVQSWLAQQPEFPSSPPDEADEDTLMFAMMTKLDPHARNLFIALMHGQTSVSSSRAPTPAERPTQSSTALQRAKKALQRLYRLDKPPRDCEAAMYLLTNAHLHGMLATLAEVNEAEWDILVSGRFDGFLWSGAEAPFPPSVSQYNSPIASRGPSRGGMPNPHSRNTTPFSGVSQQSRAQQHHQQGQTPFSPLRNVVSPADSLPGHLFPSRGPTPGGGLHGLAAPPPVQMDEDTEIAVLAEVERNLFNDMERFEDAFEILHSRAELVRQLLRERSAGLSLQSQLRRGSNASELDARLGTPASGVTDIEGQGQEEEDDGLGDLASLAPDDSASQISSGRRERGKRERRETRRTPVPGTVYEEEEGGSVFEEFRGESRGESRNERRKGGGRRSKY